MTRRASYFVLFLCFDFVVWACNLPWLLLYAARDVWRYLRTTWKYAGECIGGQG